MIGDRCALCIDQPQARFALYLADTRHTRAASRCSGLHRCACARRRGECQLVVVAAGQYAAQLNGVGHGGIKVRAPARISVAAHAVSTQAPALDASST